MIFLRPSLATFDWNKSLNFLEYTSAIYVKLDLDWSSEDFWNPRKLSSGFRLSFEGLNCVSVREYWKACK